jgi:Clp amino terminal domain, pathogenicity island component
MTPTPTLQELIDGVRADAAGADPLTQLSQASAAAADLEQTTDALLGHFVDQCRRSGHSWSEISGALGVSKQAAHKRFSFDAPTFERFTVLAEAALLESEAQAHRLRHGFIGTEHILLALCEISGGPGARLLAEVGVTTKMVEDRIMAFIPSGTNSEQGKLPFTPRAKAVISNASTEASALGHDYVGTEHLLLGLFNDGNSVAAKILVEVGVGFDALKLQITELSRPPKGS